MPAKWFHLDSYLNRKCKAYLDHRGYTVERTHLGSGGIGDVYKANYFDRWNCAVKVFYLPQYKKDSEAKYLFQELYLMKKLKHENVIAVMDTYCFGSWFFIFMEMANKGDLGHRIYTKPYLTESTGATIFYDVCKGLKYIHSKGFAHRDIKSANVLLDMNKDSKCVAKLADFGFACFTFYPKDGRPHDRKSLCGTMVYQAPEIIRNYAAKTRFTIAPFDAQKADIWSMAVMLVEMLTRQLLFLPANYDDPQRKKFLEDLENAANALASNKCKGLSKSVKGLLKQMFNNDPAGRPDIEKVMEDTWIKSLVPKEDWEKKVPCPCELRSQGSVSPRNENRDTPESSPEDYPD